MVYTREDTTEEITDAYEETRYGQQRVCVETDDGYFQYWFPYTDVTDKKYVDADTVLDPMHMHIVEAPNEASRTEYTGSDPITVPASVVERAEEVSGYSALE